MHERGGRRAVGQEETLPPTPTGRHREKETGRRKRREGTLSHPTGLFRIKKHTFRNESCRNNIETRGLLMTRSSIWRRVSESGWSFFQLLIRTKKSGLRTSQQQNLLMLPPHCMFSKAGPFLANVKQTYKNTFVPQNDQLFRRVHTHTHTGEWCKVGMGRRKGGRERERGPKRKEEEKSPKCWRGLMRGEGGRGSPPSLLLRIGTSSSLPPFFFVFRLKYSCLSPPPLPPPPPPFFLDCVWVMGLSDLPRFFPPPSFSFFFFSFARPWLRWEILV